jgi:hypothetical protein
MNDQGNDIEEKPNSTEKDRLHRVKADEFVSLFENEKNNPTDEWNAGESSGYVGH